MSAFDDVSTATRSVGAAAGPSTVAIGRHGRGTGVVIASGRVLTSAHNLRDRTTQVTFVDGRSEQARVLGSDSDHDVVVLEVDTGDTPALDWASAPAQVGDVVFAVGRSLRGERVTFGVVTAVDRAFRGPRGRRINGAVEHTAPMARGSSGGPLVDREGRLLAVNTHRLGEGFYVGLPADADLRARVDTLSSGQSIRGRRLGIAVVPGPVAARMRRRVGLADQPGLLVQGVVPGSPAAEAGVGEGDLVVGVGDADVASVDDLWDVLDAAAETVTLRLVRGSDQRTVTVSFAEAEHDGPGDEADGEGPAEAPVPEG